MVDDAAARGTDTLTYGFRLRFFIHGPRLKSDALSEHYELADGRQVTLAATWPDVKLCDTRDLKLTSGGFKAQADAEACGRRLRNALVASMAELKLGIDTGNDRGTLQVSESMRASFASLGYQLFDNVHGLLVFEEQPVPRFMLGQATAYVSRPTARFLSEWGRQYELDRQLSDKEALAFETYATSEITPNPASCDRLKTGHFGSFGDVVPYFELESFGKLAA